MEIVTYTLWPNWTEIVTLNANIREIVTVHTIKSQIEQKLLLQMKILQKYHYIYHCVL